MEGIVVLSNNKPLLTSQFLNPRLADLAVDAFLAAKRAIPSSSYSTQNSSNDPSSSTSNGSSSSSLNPVIWFDAVNGHAGTQVATTASSRKNGRARESYSVDSEESDEDDEEESEQDEVEDNAWATPGDSTTNGQASTVLATSSYACCHITHNALHFLVPISSESDPAVAFSYLYSLLGVLKQYLGGEVTETSLRESFDTVLQLFAETFSSPYPISTDASALQELVPSSSLLAKVLSAGMAVASATAAKGIQGGAAAGAASAQHLSGRGGEVVTPFSSPLHWRRAGIRHAQNEIYFDVREEIQAVLDKDGKLVTGNVWGRIDCRSKLSGMPDISLNFSNPSMLEDPSFHPCVRLGKWTSSKTLSFIPPDGEFELMGYRLSQSNAGAGTASRRSTSSSSALAQSSGAVPIPLRVRPVITIGEIGGSFSISLAPPTQFAGGVTNLEDVLVTLYLGESATGVNGSITSSTSGSGSTSGGMGSGGSYHGSRHPGANGSGGDKLSPPGGKWEYDPLSHVLRWKIPKLSLNSNSPTLSGTWQFDESSTKSKARSMPSPVIDVRFSAALSNISGLSIVNLRLEGEKYSVYKGFRSHLNGNLEVRW